MQLIRHDVLKSLQQNMNVMGQGSVILLGSFKACKKAYVFL